MPENGKSGDRSPANGDGASSASGDNASTVQVNLRVEEEQKEHWEDYLDETHQYNSLSQLIRSAVEAEISGTDQATSSESPAVASDIQEMKSKLERVRKDVSWLRNQEQDAVDISDVAQDVLDELKPLPDVNPASDADVYREEYAAVTGIEEYGPQTVRVLADELGVEQEDVEDAIKHLQDQFLPIVEVKAQGGRHYFMEE